MNGHFETMFLVAVNVLLSICNSWVSLQSCCALTHFITNRTYNKGRGLLVLLVLLSVMSREGIEMQGMVEVSRF